MRQCFLNKLYLLHYLLFSPQFEFSGSSICCAVKEKAVMKNIITA